MKKLCVAAGLITLAACGQAPREQSGEVSPTSDSAGPEVGVTAAPGVAFDYRYRFRAPPREIAALQEKHAAACEALGTARCRITGMRYTVDGERSVSAMLAFRLDPAIARDFGKRGIAMTVAADGMLTDAEITGTDAGGEIRRLDRDGDALAAQVADLDRRLAARGLTATERAELQRQRAALLEARRGVGAVRGDRVDSLASTPMTFEYRSGVAVRAFIDDAPFTAALDLAVRSAQVTLSTALTALALLGPPAALLALLWLAWRALRPVLARRRSAPAPAA